MWQHPMIMTELRFESVMNWMCLLKICMLKLYLSMAWYKRWNLSEVIRIRWDNVGGALLSGICALTRVMRELVSPLCSPPSEDITRIWQSITWKRALTGTNHDGTLIWNLQNLWKKIGYNLFRLWYFVRAAKTKIEPTAGIPETLCNTYLL